jgi:hypothetical protein
VRDGQKKRPSREGLFLFPGIGTTMDAPLSPSRLLMTTPSVEAAPAKPAALWEDFIEIFTSPSTVYERRRDANPWPMILIITVLMTMITVLTFNSLEPVYDAEIRDQLAKVMAKTPQMTADMLNTQVKIQLFVRRWTGLFFFIGALIMSLPVWLLGRITGAKELNYTRSMVVLTWASIIALVGLLVMGIQGLVMDVSTITTVDKLGLSAARFVDKATVSPAVYGALKALDPFAIWGAIVMGIGVRVVGRGTKNTAIAFTVTWLVVAMLIGVVVAMRQAM